MLEDGRLRRVETKVDVRSIYNYIENPKQSAFTARYEKKHGHKVKNQINFYASAISRPV